MLMKLKEMFEKIESYDFAAYVGIASDLRIFFIAASEQAVVKELIEALDSQDTLQALFFRIYLLSQQDIAEDYRHPHDIALAIYLWLISKKELKLAKLAADCTLQAKNLFWARKVIEMILECSKSGTCV
jgi:hypothetical protein